MVNTTPLSFVKLYNKCMSKTQGLMTSSKYHLVGNSVGSGPNRMLWRRGNICDPFRFSNLRAYLFAVSTTLPPSPNAQHKV